METTSSDDAIDHATKFLAEQEQQPNDIAAKEHKERIGRQLSQLFAILAFFRGQLNSGIALQHVI